MSARTGTCRAARSWRTPRREELDDGGPESSSDAAINNTVEDHNGRVNRAEECCSTCLVFRHVVRLLPSKVRT